MAIKQLNDEQIRTWTLEQKDRWWLENVWRGDMPQLTVRSALTGMLLGGMLSLTNLYVGAKTGWTLGVGITSVILAFAMFKVLSRRGPGQRVHRAGKQLHAVDRHGGRLHDRAHDLVAGRLHDGHRTGHPHGCTTLLWIIVAVRAGRAVRLSRSNAASSTTNSIRFPKAGRPASSWTRCTRATPREGMFKAKLLAVSGGCLGPGQAGSSQAIMDKLGWGSWPCPSISTAGSTDSATPQHFGTTCAQLTVRPDTDIVMMAAGGLMGIRTGVSLMVGAVINYCVLAPWMIAARRHSGAR